MMMRVLLVAALLAGAESTSATVSASTARAHANPIRKVVAICTRIGNGSRDTNLNVQSLSTGAWFCVVRIIISRKLPREEEASCEEFLYGVHINACREETHHEGRSPS